MISLKRGATVRTPVWLLVVHALIVQMTSFDLSKEKTAIRLSDEINERLDLHQGALRFEPGMWSGANPAGWTGLHAGWPNRATRKIYRHPAVTRFNSELAIV